MKKSNNFIKLLTVICLLHGGSVASPADEEVEVILQFFEFELEDICSLKSEALWDYLNGDKSDLRQLLNLELKEADLYKNETKALKEFLGKTFFDKRLQRLFDIFFYPGAPLLGAQELKEYKEYSIKLEEIKSKMTIGCPKSDVSEEPKEGSGKECVAKNARRINEILAKEKDEKKLKELWSEWFEELQKQNEKTKFGFMEQLSILDMEAEQNEEDDLSDYWLKQADITDLDYHKISHLWKEIIPLYQKIRKYMADILKHHYGNKAFIDRKLFPMHLLGSLQPESWIAAAEKLGAFDNAEPYKILKSKLSQKNTEDLYKMADSFTSEVKIGDLPPQFYEDSLFNSTSPVCKDKLFDYCARKNAYRAISCSDEDVTITRFIKIHENVANLKHLILAGREVLEEENGFLFTEGPRDSVIYEAVSGLSSLIAVRPKNLKRQRLLPEKTLPNEEILSLLISALHIIPALPYYLAADLWRINALKEIDASTGETTYETSTTTYSSTWSTTPVDEDSPAVEKRDASEEGESSEVRDETRPGENTESAKEINFSETTPTVNESYSTQAISVAPKIYDFDNLTADWWKYREQLQGVGNTDGKLYPDFLQDEKIIWNKPYVSKFLGKILQFQLLEYFRRENFTTNTIKIQSLLGRGKSVPYKDILIDLFNITEISTEPLLMYFKPLEEFLDAGAHFQNKTSPGDSDNFNLFSQSFSMNSADDNGEEVEKSSNTIVFALLILIVLGIIIVTVFVALKRHRKNQRAKEKRKRLNEAVN